jgi:hypothetical protein
MAARRSPPSRWLEPTRRVTSMSSPATAAQSKSPIRPSPGSHSAAHALEILCAEVLQVEEIAEQLFVCSQRCSWLLRAATFQNDISPVRILYAQPASPRSPTSSSARLLCRIRCEIVTHEFFSVQFEDHPTALVTPAHSLVASARNGGRDQSERPVAINWNRWSNFPSFRNV